MLVLSTALAGWLWLACHMLCGGALVHSLGRAVAGGPRWEPGEPERGGLPLGVTVPINAGFRCQVTGFPVPPADTGGGPAGKAAMAGAEGVMLWVDLEAEGDENRHRSNRGEGVPDAGPQVAWTSMWAALGGASGARVPAGLISGLREANVVRELDFLSRRARANAAAAPPPALGARDAVSPQCLPSQPDGASLSQSSQRPSPAEGTLSPRPPSALASPPPKPASIASLGTPGSLSAPSPVSSASPSSPSTPLLPSPSLLEAAVDESWADAPAYEELSLPVTRDAAQSAGARDTQRVLKMPHRVKFRTSQRLKGEVIVHTLGSTSAGWSHWRPVMSEVLPSGLAIPIHNGFRCEALACSLAHPPADIMVWVCAAEPANRVDGAAEAGAAVWRACYSQAWPAAEGDPELLLAESAAVEADHNNAASWNTACFCGGCIGWSRKRRCVLFRNPTAPCLCVAHPWSDSFGTG
ncbi:hypothetical protein CYMTET_43151 [Cymbomonas tetramitiformis]|uniref:Uncharacterized protein n=1 Tax=Cymbomonas tetramitiformis TaxID=36881 RepID=A0AAE0C4M7_9CHLO|nr:hypothetical protein CYMTET_43151 [Cymbomonas tetramitiformis]